MCMKADRYQSIPELVAAKLQELIAVEKKYLPGEQIPTEAELTAQFGVSRNSVREAVKLLVNSGVLEIRRGCGTFVRQLGGEEDGLLRLIRSADDVSLLRDWMDVRQNLEPLAVKLAIARGTDEQKAEIRRWALSCEEYIGQASGFAEADKRFHISIARASGNCVIMSLLPAMETAIADILNVNLYAIAARSDRPFTETVVMEHKLIAEQILAGNATAASNLMRGHLEKVALYLEDGIRILQQDRRQA